jgi:hypothetical protein
MRGNWPGFWTALLSFILLLWQSYLQYQRENPTAMPQAQPVYWSDGQHWYCKVGSQTYIWRPTSGNELQR